MKTTPDLQVPRLAPAAGEPGPARRRFLAQAAAAGAALAAVPGMSMAAAEQKEARTGQQRAAFLQQQREQAEAFARSFYEAKDELNLQAFGAHFADPSVYTDAVLLGPCAAPASRADRMAMFQGLFAALGVPARASKFVHASGDLRYGIVAEYVDVPGTFYSKAFDLMALLEIKGGLVSTDIDYWDSWQLPLSEIVGPAATVAKTEPYTPSGPTVDVPIAYSLAPVHAGGVPRYVAPCATAGAAADASHAAPEMLALARALNKALSQGQAGRLASLFSDDALLIHPLLHVGAPGYGAFNRGIQLRGKKAIARFFQALIEATPDGAGSRLTRVVGGPSGGGYTWKAGGAFAAQGLDRQGIDGITAVDLDDEGDKIIRMSVKFDSFHLTEAQRQRVQQRLQAHGLV